MATAAIRAVPEQERAQTLVRALPPLLALALAMAVGFTMMGSFSTVQEAPRRRWA